MTCQDVIDIFFLPRAIFFCGDRWGEQKYTNMARDTRGEPGLKSGFRESFLEAATGEAFGVPFVDKIHDDLCTVYWSREDMEGSCYSHMSIAQGLMPHTCRAQLALLWMQVLSERGLPVTDDHLDGLRDLVMQFKTHDWFAKAGQALDGQHQYGGFRGTTLSFRNAVESFLAPGDDGKRCVDASFNAALLMPVTLLLARIHCSRSVAVEPGLLSVMSAVARIITNAGGGRTRVLASSILPSIALTCLYYRFLRTSGHETGFSPMRASDWDMMSVIRDDVRQFVAMVLEEPDNDAWCGLDRTMFGEDVEENHSGYALEAVKIATKGTSGDLQSTEISFSSSSSSSSSSALIGGKYDRLLKKLFKRIRDLRHVKRAPDEDKAVRDFLERKPFSASSIQSQPPSLLKESKRLRSDRVLKYAAEYLVRMVERFYKTDVSKDKGVGMFCPHAMTFSMIVSIILRGPEWPFLKTLWNSFLPGGDVAGIGFMTGMLHGAISANYGAVRENPKTIFSLMGRYMLCPQSLADTVDTFLNLPRILLDLDPSSRGKTEKKGEDVFEMEERITMKILHTPVLERHMMYRLSTAAALNIAMYKEAIMTALLQTMCFYRSPEEVIAHSNEILERSLQVAGPATHRALLPLEEQKLLLRTALVSYWMGPTLSMDGCGRMDEYVDDDGDGEMDWDAYFGSLSLSEEEEQEQENMVAVAGNKLGHVSGREDALDKRPGIHNPLDKLISIHGDVAMDYKGLDERTLYGLKFDGRFHEYALAIKPLFCTLNRETYPYISVSRFVSSLVSCGCSEETARRMVAAAGIGDAGQYNNMFSFREFAMATYCMSPLTSHDVQLPCGVARLYYIFRMFDSSRAMKWTRHDLLEIVACVMENRHQVASSKEESHRRSLAKLISWRGKDEWEFEDLVAAVRGRALTGTINMFRTRKPLL
jgi:hypothetical protein